QNNYNHYVDYAVNGVKATGVHQVKIRYYANGNALVSVAVNGSNAIPSVQLPPTYSWNIVWREETFNVTLNQGNNTLRIQGLPGYAVRQDKICVTGDGSTNPDPNPVTCNFAIAPTANSQSYTPQQAMTFNANCTGADCGSVTYAWTGNGANATGASANINAPSAPGDYTYTLKASKAGCADKTASLTIHVGTNTPAECDFNVTAAPSNATPACSAAISLTATCSGANCSGVAYQWTGNSINLSGISVNTNAPGTNGAFNYTVTASKNGCTSKTATASITVANCQPPTGEPLNLCLEAENSDGNGPVTGDPNASGGKTRGDQNNYNHYVDYTVNGVKAAGTYQLKLRYYASGNPLVSLAVNGTVVLPSVQLPSTYTWNIVWREEIINITLAEGNNTVRIQGLPGPSLRQDKICVTGGGQNARMDAPEAKTQTTHVEEALTVYPNPSTSHFEAKFKLVTDGEGIITVTDVQGKSWYNSKVKGKGSHQEQIRLNGAPAGIYILQIKKGYETETKKLLLIR
ncbi:MAG: T9SS type A sorting domain-containing protein, partial [Dyadobacter sp.]|uniref:T9SS type A sorting domain-containing protein n=1 Tax=Dyadobacter sp. TaxID=1914288 RepID=UPI0032659DDA